MTERPRDDRDLVETLKQGREDAAEVLVSRYAGLVYRVAQRLLADARDAEEVTQDVLLTVLRKIHTFRGEAAFSSWLYRISANAAYQRLRARRAQAEVSLEAFLPVFDEEGRYAEPVVDWSQKVQDPAVAAEARETIERSLSRLPAEYRAVIVLHDVEGLPNRDVAAALGISVAAVKSRVHRARLFLRGQLAGLFPGPLR